MHESSNFHDFGFGAVSSMDKVRNIYLSRKSSNYIQQLPSSRIADANINLEDSDAQFYVQQFDLGWARPVRNVSRFSEKQKVFIQNLFLAGEKTKKKMSAERMAEKMKSEKLKSGNIRFFYFKVNY